MAWLYVPKINTLEKKQLTEYPCAQELVESNSDCKLQSQRIEPYVTLRGKYLPLASWRNTLKKIPWMKHLFGTILQPSTANYGTEKWISCLPECRVNLILLSERDSDSKIKEAQVFSHKSQELSLKLNPPWYFLKMSRNGSRVDISNLLEKSYQNWVIESKNLSSYRRKQLEQAISVPGYSYWPTPCAEEGKRSTISIESIIKDATQEILGRFVLMWPNTSKKKLQELYFHQNRTESTNGKILSKNGRYLNPLFVEWLMGFPINWTDSDVSETQLSHWLQQQRSEYLRLMQALD